MSTVFLRNPNSDSFNVYQVENPSAKLPILSIESFSFLAKEKVELHNRVVTQAFFQSFEGYDSSYFDDEKVFLLKELTQQSPLDLNFLTVNDFLLYELKKGLEDVHKIIQEFGSENLFRNSHLEKLEKLTLILTSNCGVDSVDFASTRYKVDFKKIALMQAKICSAMFLVEGLNPQEEYSPNYWSNSDLAISIAKQLFRECHLFSQILVKMQGVKGVKKIPHYDQKKKALDENLVRFAQIIGLISSFTSSNSGVDFFKTSSLSKTKFPLLTRDTSFSFEEKLNAFIEYVDHLKKVAEKYQSANKAYHSKGSVFAALERKLKILKKENNAESKNKHFNDLINLLFEKLDEIEKEFRSHIEKNGTQKTAT